MDKAWWENFITYDGLNYWFVAWDETQANALGKFDSYKEAKEAVLTYAKTLNKKESTMDFQLGDEVFCLLNGEGVVVEFINDSLYRPVVVKFAGGRLEHYSLVGHFAISNKNPCLYHKGTVVTIKPAQPKRYKWVNVYVNTDGDCEFSDKYCSKIAARELGFCNIPNYKYVDTIQLKPKGE